jgi:hypothetical protein
VLNRRKMVPERRPYYDEKDKAALKLMRKLRHSIVLHISCSVFAMISGFQVYYCLVPVLK